MLYLSMTLRRIIADRRPFGVKAKWKSGDAAYRIFANSSAGIWRRHQRVGLEPHYVGYDCAMTIIIAQAIVSLGRRPEQ